MKKERRIRKNEEFQLIIQEKRYKANESFVVYYKEKKEENNRIGISVGKKIGKAVIRNKIKRQMRSMLREKDFQKLPFDCIIIVRPKFLDKPYQKNQESLSQLIASILRLEGENNV